MTPEARKRAIDAARTAVTETGPRFDVLGPPQMLTSWVWELRRVITSLLEIIDAETPAPVTGYLVDGKTWHPSDVTIIRAEAPTV